MVPLRPEAHEHLLERLGVAETPGLLALRHAVRFEQAGLWGDDSLIPRSLVLLRPAGPHREAFGVGRPEPAVRWLSGLAGPIVLAAPEDWIAPVETAIPGVERFETLTYFDPPHRDPGPPPAAPTRRLEPADRAAFERLAPDWALRAWGHFDALLTHGAGFVVTTRGTDEPTPRLLSAAWIFDTSDRHDALAVWTDPAYRRLGLARASARALLTHIARDRGKAALWSTSPANPASLALARRLGFRDAQAQPLLRWGQERTP